MKHTLIGTAGHVDHGKTALIRALTGIETDRLSEEKSRGITIDIGFAHLSLPGGETVSIIDVPGHEKFIKNMLAGAGGIDLVLLVIAADDGIMPQTREHMGIMQLLNAKDGIIVLTKCDLADEDWQDLVCDDIREFTVDTFLKDAPIIRVSSYTGYGIEQLKNCINKKVVQISEKNITAPFRIPVDRVFSAEGFGTVVTGTLIEGMLCKGNAVMLYPAGNEARVRQLQVHGSQSEVAYAGQRVAVNLSGVHRDEMQRGFVLAKPESLQSTKMLDVKLSLMKDGQRDIKSGSRLHFHYGTDNRLCKIVLMGKDVLSPGQSAYAQLRFNEDIALKNNDSFVVRFYSPIETIGGGVVLNTKPKKYKRMLTSATIRVLEALERGDIDVQVSQAIASFGGVAQLDKLQMHITCSHEIDTLVASGQIMILASQYAIDDTSIRNFEAKIINILEDYHKKNPLHSGMPKEELRSRVLPSHRPTLFDELLGIYNHCLQVEGNQVALVDFKVNYTKEEYKIRTNIMQSLAIGGFVPPSITELLTSNKKKTEAVLEALLAEGVVISTEPGMVFDSSIIQKARDILHKIADDGDGTVTLSQFRDNVGTSRKFALSILEYFDRIGLTRKLGDCRVLSKQ